MRYSNGAQLKECSWLRKLIRLIGVGIILVQPHALIGQSLSDHPIEYSRFSVDSLYILGRQLSLTSSDSAMNLGHEMEKISQRINYSVGIAKAKEIKARAGLNQSLDSFNLGLAEEALEYAKSVEADSVVLEAIHLLGGANYRNKKIHRTYEYNRLGRELAKEYGIWEKEYQFTINAAFIMADVNDYEQAFHYFDQTIALLKKQPDNAHFAQLYFNMSKVAFYQKDYAKARDYIERSRQFSADLDAFYFIGFYLLESNLLLEEGDITKSEKVLSKADSLLTGKNYSRFLVDLSLNKAKIAFSNAKFIKAINHIEDALPRADKSNYLRAKQSLLELYFQSLQRTGDYKKANEVMTQFVLLKDSIEFNQNQNRLRIALASANFEKEQEILNIEIEKGKARQRYIGLLAGLVIVFLGSFLLVLKRNERSLKKLNTELEIKSLHLDKANKTKNKLFSIIGHDFKAPIANLKSLLELLLKKQIANEDFVKYLPQLKNRVDHVLLSLNNTLLWGMGQLEGYKTTKKAFDLSVVANDSIQLLQGNLNEKQIQIVNEISPETQVWADSHQIEIVLRNLLSNAIKFTPNKGTIELGSTNQGDSWKVWIKDSGVGMTEKMIEQIFLMKEKVTTSGTENEKGTGLGLSLCMEMISKNDGDFWVNSEVNKGSKFIFVLPGIKNPN